MRNVLVVSGHPDLSSSNANTNILEVLAQELSALSIRRLDECYGDGPIDVRAEQEALLEADVIVLQFPFYWYSVPALLKRWLDDVFSYNFAFGPEGNKLKGKHLILSVTTGGPADSYTPLGFNHFSVEQLLRPLEQTAYLAGLHYHPPVYTHRMVYIEGDYNRLSDVQQRAREHGMRLVERVDGVLHSSEQRIRAFVAEWFSLFDALPESPAALLEHLSEEVVLEVPEGQYKGHAGFRDWHQQLREMFPGEVRHEVGAIYVTLGDQEHEVSFKVRVSASSGGGRKDHQEPVSVTATERWKVTLSEAGKVKIQHYGVK